MFFYSLTAEGLLFFQIRGSEKKVLVPGGRHHSKVASKYDGPRQLSEEDGAKQHEFLWTAGLESQKQMTRDEKDEILQVTIPSQVQDGIVGTQSHGHVPCKHPDSSLPSDHGSNHGCDGNLWAQSQGCMPCKHPESSLPSDHGSNHGCDGNLWIQSQGYGSNNGCDGNLWMQSEGPAPYTQPIHSLPAESNESGLGGSLWMKPQGVHPVVEDHSKCGKVEGHGKWMHVGYTHPHTPDRSRSTAAAELREDENFASVGAFGCKMLDGFDISDQKISCLTYDIGGAKEPGMMYFPTKWGAKEPQNPQNQRVVAFMLVFCTSRWVETTNWAMKKPLVA